MQSYKLKNNRKIDSTGIVHNRELLSNLLNKNIIAGQECKTNEYYNGKRVYVKEIDFGNIVIGSTEIIYTGIPETYKIVRVLFKGYNPAKGYFALPYFADSDTHMAINTITIESVAYSAVGDYFKDFNLICEFYYTKN